MPASRITLLVFAAASIAAAQSAAPAAQPATPASHDVWKMQDSGSAASLRGIDSVDGNVAWASGTEGTVLKTTDGGAHWTKCGVPDAATDGATLDFRGVQAWDADTAIVMASGPGDKSRLYKTTDGCKTWKLLLKNTDPDGFYDSVAFWDRQHGILLGDPVRSVPAVFGTTVGGSATSVERFELPRFLALMTSDAGESWAYWRIEKSDLLEPGPAGGAAFAASNSSARIVREISEDSTGHPYKTVETWIGIGGKGGARVFLGFALDADMAPSEMHWSRPIKVPMTGGSDSSGVFSLGFRLERNLNPQIDFTGDRYHHGVAVGGDYTKPNDRAGTAAWSADGGLHWHASTTPPHGYRSSVQWSQSEKLWITAGTNGSDLSRDDGRTWQPLDNGNWNALSLPFVVGPNGRIARLNAGAITTGIGTEGKK